MLKLAIKCLQLALFCLEKTVKFITGYCYIYTALTGCGFCIACFKVFSLIIGNAAQLAVNTLVRARCSWPWTRSTGISSGLLPSSMLLHSAVPKLRSEP